MPATKLVYHQILDPQCQQQHLHPRVQNRDCAHTGSEFSTLRQPYTYTLDNLRTNPWTRIAVTIWGAKPRSLIEALCTPGFVTIKGSLYTPAVVP